MPRTRAEQKAKLQAERMIDALLDWSEGTKALKLTEIELEVLKLRQRFAEKLAEAAVKQQATAAPVIMICLTYGLLILQRNATTDGGRSIFLRTYLVSMGDLGFPSGSTAGKCAA